MTDEETGAQNVTPFDKGHMAWKWKNRVLILAPSFQNEAGRKGLLNQMDGQSRGKGTADHAEDPRTQEDVLGADTNQTEKGLEHSGERFGQDHVVGWGTPETSRTDLRFLKITAGRGDCKIDMT